MSDWSKCPVCGGLLMVSASAFFEEIRCTDSDCTYAAGVAIEPDEECAGDLHERRN